MGFSLPLPSRPGPKVLQAVRQQKNAALQWAVVTPRRKASPEAGRKLRGGRVAEFYGLNMIFVVYIYIYISMESQHLGFK